MWPTSSAEALRSIRGGALGLAGALLLVGCGGGPGDSAAPHVVLDPLDVGSYRSVPCELLRADRARRRHLLTPGSVTAGPDGPRCAWAPAAPRVPAYSAGVTTLGGLDAVTRRRSAFAMVERTDIAHYPALHTRDPAPAPTGRCATRVGVAPDSQVIVTATEPGDPPRSTADACGDADILATEIVDQLLAGSG